MSEDILVTGASSYVGARIVYDLQAKGIEVIGTSNNSTQFKDIFERMDITDKHEVFDILTDYNPKIVVHCAANASSKECDQNPELARKINEDGTRNVVGAANLIDAFFIHISSTVVVLEKSQYETTKLAAEGIVEEESKRGFAILRPSVVFGMSPNKTTNKPFNQILWMIEGQEPEKYLQDASWRFQPTWIGQFAEAICKIQEDPKAEGIRNKTIPLVVSDEASIYDIANDLLTSFGKQALTSCGKNYRAEDERVGRLDLAALKRSGIPIHTYEDFKARITSELRTRDKYTLQKQKH